MSYTGMKWTPEQYAEWLAGNYQVPERREPGVVYRPVVRAETLSGGL